MQKIVGTKSGPFVQSPEPGNLALNAKTPFHCDVDNGKPNPKKNFFSISGTRLVESIEGLNTSLAAGKMWLCKLFKYFQQNLGPGTERVNIA